MDSSIKPLSQTETQSAMIAAVAEENDVGGGSNSSNSTGCGNKENDPEFFNDEPDGIVMETISANSVFRFSPSFHENSGLAADGEVPELLGTEVNSRANFSRFGTPVDETKNNCVPEDFDELFKGQLGTSCMETSCRFDEGIEPQVIVDVADYSNSKSSDVEDVFSSISSNTVTCDTGDTTSNESSNIRDDADPPLYMEEWLRKFSSWNNTERLTAVTELIDLCEDTQMRHMMQVIEPQFQRDFISLLPKELALYVLSFLDPLDLLRAALTCKQWRILIDDNLLWREKCKEAGIGYFSAMANRVHRRDRNNADVPNTRWKAAFMKQHYVDMNWKRKDLRDYKVLKGHDDHVVTCLQLSGSRIVSGSDDNTLKIWCANSGKCLQTLLGHTGGVWSSQISGETIVSGSTDRTLRVWNAETGQSLHTLFGHTSTVRCMSLHGTKVVSGARDATLRMWDVETGECLLILLGHLAAIRCVQYNGQLIVSGSYDFTVRIWDPENEDCLHELVGHTNRIYTLQFDGIHVVSSSLDTTMRVWDVESGACKQILVGHQSLTVGMELRDNLLFSGNADSTVKIWDIYTGHCLRTLAGPDKHLSAVNCIQLINKFVVTSSDDGTVKLWEIETGEFVRDLLELLSGGIGGVVWRIRASETKLVCAVGSRNGTEETRLIVLDFDADGEETEPKVEEEQEVQLD